MRLQWSTFALAASFSLPVIAQQQTFVYPAKGQSPAQQQQDEYQCHQWAVGQTGFDPVNPPPKPGQAPPPPQGTVLKSAAGAAIVGTAVAGATGGNRGEGAAIGAVFGGVRGAQKAKQQQAQQAAQQQAQAQASGPVAYGRARTGCLTGRGYTIS